MTDTTSGDGAVPNGNVYATACEYVNAGLFVFPVTVTRDASGRKTVRPHGEWRKGSSNRLTDVERWWGPQGIHRSAGILIDCGKSKLVVVDPDGQEGIGNWYNLFENACPPGPLWVVPTAGGGEHWYYRASDDHVIGNDQDGKVAPHVDVRGLGGFVIAPPTSDGVGQWRWGAGPDWTRNAPVPDLVIERMTKRAPDASPATYAHTVNKGPEQAFEDDLFDDVKGERRFTKQQAIEFVKAERVKLAATRQGFNGAINNFAMACAHFPWLVDRDLCARLMIKTLGPVTGWAAPDRQDEATINSAYSATEAGKSWVAVEVEGNPSAVGATEGASPPEDEDIEPEDRYTDAMLSGRLTREELTGRALYSSALGWLVWDGKRWAAREDEVIHEIVRKWVLVGYAGAVDAYRALPAPDHKLSEDPAVRGWAGAQSASRIASIAKLARGQLLRSADEFDTDADLLNTPGGVIDLRTGEVYPHDPARLVTKIAGAAFVVGAESEALKRALEAVPDDARDWLQRRLGEAATGHSGEQLVLLSGTGRNGKTLLMGAAYRALGDYAAKVPNTLLLRARQSGGATPERMTLRGVRLAYMEETPEDGYLDATVVKDLLDAEEIEGRHLYRDFVHWRPSHSLFLNTNHPPTMGDTGDGAWRRLTRLDFPYRFRRESEEIESDRDRPGDPGLKRALATQEGQQALLAWVVAGARAYYEHGTEERPPPSVVAGVRRWREESDDLLRFVAQEMAYDPDGAVAFSDMYEAVATWLKANGQRPLSAKTFAQRMAVHSIMAKRVTYRKISSSKVSRPVHRLQDGLAAPLAARVWGYEGLRFKDDQGLDQEE